MEWINEHKTAIFVLELIVGVWLITSTPELRSLKLRLKLLAGLLAIVSLFYFQISSSPVLDTLIKLMLVRPIFFVCGLLWSSVTGYYASRAFESLYDATEDSSSIPCTGNYSLPRYFRQIGRVNFALAETKRRLKENPDDVEGNYLLACLYAEDLKDLDGARDSIQKLLGNLAVGHAVKELLLTHYEAWRQKLRPYDASAKLAMPSGSLKPKNALDAVRELRSSGHLKQAVAALEKQLKNDPSDYEALLLGMRIHAEDLKDLVSAQRWLEKIQAISPLPSGYAEYAKASMDAWQNKTPTPPRPAAADEPAEIPPVDFGYVNAKKHRENARYGTAIECIQNHLKACPNDFEGLFLLAAIYAESCSDLHSADKVIRQIERAADIAPEEKTKACQQMKCWRESHLKRTNRPL
jgi:tetratricopeptide (TPR) repeat protein